MPSTHLIALRVTHILPMRRFFIARAIITKGKPAEKFSPRDSFPAVDRYQQGHLLYLEQSHLQPDKVCSSVSNLSIIGKS